MDPALIIELKALLEKYAPQNREVYTIAEFCAVKNFSKSSFNKLQRRGLAPETKRLPGLSLLRITQEARQAWRARMDALLAAEALALQAKHAELVEKRRAAGRKAAASPHHVSKRGCRSRISQPGMRENKDK